MGGSARFAPWLRIALVALALLGARPVAAQQTASAGDSLVQADPELGSFAKAFLAVGLVRDDFNGQLALPKNKTVEHQTEIREQMKVKIEETIRASGLTPDSYRRIEYSITVDQSRRARFDRILEELARAS